MSNSIMKPNYFMSEENIKSLYSGEYIYLVDGKCSNCGECCSNFLALTESEIRKIKRYIKAHNIKPHIKKAPTVEKVIDAMCPFRNDKDKKCDIYSIRPLICREYRCDAFKMGWEFDVSKLHGASVKLVSMRQEFFGIE